eukprot:TRINITY_DN7887_c0_g1_i3.p1 TRINITY_DN7887_c0_g1~~TRINITY_DN7887_c0_g1_i3.p1  ORF type:complete len:369 (-),score=81.99 TRINITY_DN7887_c0_g1_i3:29-1087(-)
MKAVGITKFGGVENIHAVSIPKPACKGGDILVEIKAVSTNPVDGKIRSGAFPTGQKASEDSPVILGYDASGVVAEVGDQAKGFRVGDEVMFSGVCSRAGTNAQFCAVDSRIVGRKPKGWTHEQAAAIPLTGLTAWEGLVDQLHVPLTPELDKMYETDTKPQAGPNGKVLLVMGGAGGVGSIAIALAKAFNFQTIIATASRPESTEYCKKMGATHVINHKEDMKKQLKDQGYEGVDLIFNTAATDENFNRLVDIMNPHGSMVCINETEEKVAIGHLMPRSCTFTYELMFARPMHNDRPELQGKALNALATLAEAGQIPDRVTKTLSLSKDLAEAHTKQESGTMLGKQILVQDL